MTYHPRELSKFLFFRSLIQRIAIHEVFVRFESQG